MKYRVMPWRPAVLLAFSALLVGIPASASAAPAAANTGFVSLGNLSESPSPVDIYLYSSGNSSPQFVQHDVAYGTILPYQAVSAGSYSVKMRAAGSSASSNPVWSVSLTVKAGGAYTVVPLRASAQQGQLKVIDNNLTTPKGKSFVRVIQAAVNQQQVTFHCSCAPGTPGNITTDAAPGTVSPQATDPARDLDHERDRPQREDEPAGHADRGHRPHGDRHRRARRRHSDHQPDRCRRGRRRHPPVASPPDSAGPRRTAQARHCRGWC